MATSVRNLDAIDWESGPDRKLAHNTYRETVRLYQEDYATAYPAVRYHATTIIYRKSEGAYVLNSGGYRTVTTKQRLNKLLPGGIQISQRNFEWTVHTRRGDIPFTDGMVVTTY